MEFEVFIAVIMKKTIFWDMTPSSQSQRVTQTSNLQASSSKFTLFATYLVFLQNMGKLLPDCMVSYPRKEYSSESSYLALNM
jgi:hypothetical protein